MNIRLSISQVARFLGVTTDAIRLYEKEGLITPLRDAHNGYRYYDYTQIRRIMFISLYRKIDIGIPELRNLLTASTFSDVHNAFTEHITANYKKIEDLHNQIGKLSVMNKAISELAADLDSIVLRTMQKGYRMIEPLNPDTEAHLISSITCSPLFSFGNISYKTCFDAAGITHRYMSFIIWEDMIHYAPIGKSISELPVLESCECISTVTTGHDNGILDLDISRLTQYCDEHGYSHSGFYYAHYVYALPVDDQIVDYYRVFMPVKKIINNA